jgi:glycosyltransferase involved in cell wall biosynthesis
MMQPWLSVIMPIHNGEALLGETLSSVAAERPEGVEFLLFDSSDDSRGVFQIVQSCSNGLAISWNPETVPTAWPAKINHGARSARAPHIVMLHQDDLWLPGHLAAVRRAIAGFPNATMSIGPSRFVGPDAAPLGVWGLPFAPGIHGGAEFARTLLVQNSIAIPSPVILRYAFLACGGMDEALWYTADWDLYLKLAQQGGVFVREEATTAFRVHGSSLTMTGSRDIADFRRQQEIVLERHMPRHQATSGATERLAHASIAVNCALAAARNGKPGRQIWRIIIELLKLGPFGALRYLRQSRVIDRLVPRIRLMLADGLRFDGGRRPST